MAGARPTRSGPCGRIPPRSCPAASSLMRQYKRWEAGEVTPKEFYQPIIAATFGTVTHAMFPVAPRRDADADLLAVSGMDTLELVSRLQRSDLDQATLDRTADHGRPAVLGVSVHAQRPFLNEGRAWLRRVADFQGQRLTLSQHREILTQAGWIAVADRMRRIRLRQPPGRRDDTPGRNGPGDRGRPRRDQGMGTRDPGLDRPDDRQLSRRRRGGARWHRSRSRVTA